MNTPAPSFSELLKNESFCASMADYELHAAQNHPAALDIAEYIQKEFGYTVKA